MRLPLRLVPSDMVVTVWSGLNRGRAWRVGSSIHGCWLGTYESAKQAVVRDLVKPGMNVLDVGAQAGFYTLAFARLAGASGRVWAFEPVAENLASLRLHIALNQADNVTVREAAVSDFKGRAAFRFGPNRLMGRLDADAPSTVEVTSLDAEVAGGMPHPDVVKIDVEGAELGVLQGAADIIARQRTAWLVALDEPRNAEACRAALAGYDIREFAPGEILATPRLGRMD